MHERAARGNSVTLLACLSGESAPEEIPDMGQAAT